MGCDWYTITSITAVGFFVDKITDKIRDKLKENGLFRCYRFAIPLDAKNVMVKYLVYDTDTRVKTKISIPGQYEIHLTDHNVIYEVVDDRSLYSENFKNEIEYMNQFFEFDNPNVFYCKILTSAGIKHYSIYGGSDEEFKEYYGYSN